MASRRNYVSLATTMPVNWLMACIAEPGHLSPRYVLLLKVAVRRINRRGGC